MCSKGYNAYQKVQGGIGTVCIMVCKVDYWLWAFLRMYWDQTCVAKMLAACVLLSFQSTPPNKSANNNNNNNTKNI